MIKFIKLYLKHLPLVYPKYKKFLKIQLKLIKEIRKRKSYEFGYEILKNKQFKFHNKNLNKINKYHKRNKKFFYHKKLLLFGSGPSLNKLKIKDKRIINNLPKITFNRNLIFWKKINVWPDYYFFVDNYGVAKNIFCETLRKISTSKKNYPVLFFEEFYKPAVPEKLKPIFFKFFHRNLNWSNSLDSNLFGCYGSLSVLMNLMSVIKLSKNILILGVDLNKPGTFFDEYRDKHSGLFNKEEKLDFKWGMHQTLYDKKEGINILTNWHLITKNLKKNGINLYCGSKDSELVKKNLVPYMSLDNFNKIK